MVSILKIKYPEGLCNMCFKFLVREFPGKAQLKSHGYSHMQSTIISFAGEQFFMVPGNLKTGHLAIMAGYYKRKKNLVPTECVF